MSMWQFIYIFGIAATVVLGLYLSFKLRPKKADPNAEPVYHFNCPGCNRRIPYAGWQAGTVGRCRQCSIRFTYPKPK